MTRPNQHFDSDQGLITNEQELVPGSELRIVEDVLGHLALFGVAPTYMPQIDRYLGELLAIAR